MKICYHPIWYFVFFVLLQLPSYSQQAVKVRPITEELLSVGHYQEQAALWKGIINDTPARAEAWLNYYTAARNIRLLSGKDPYGLDRIVVDAKEAIPNTYEAYFINFWQASWEDRQTVKAEKELMDVFVPMVGVQ